MNWEESLVEMKKELEENKKELGNLNGYKRLYKFTEAIVKLISNYKKATDTLEDAIESYKNKK